MDEGEENEDQRQREREISSQKLSVPKNEPKRQSKMPLS